MGVKSIHGTFYESFIESAMYIYLNSKLTQWIGCVERENIKGCFVRNVCVILIEDGPATIVIPDTRVMIIVDMIGCPVCRNKHDCIGIIVCDLVIQVRVIASAVQFASNMKRCAVDITRNGVHVERRSMWNRGSILIEDGPVTIVIPDAYRMIVIDLMRCPVGCDQEQDLRIIVTCTVVNVSIVACAIECCSGVNENV